jgi:hypothetical protein
MPQSSPIPRKPVPGSSTQGQPSTSATQSQAKRESGASAESVSTAERDAARAQALARLEGRDIGRASAGQDLSLLEGPPLALARRPEPESPARITQLPDFPAETRSNAPEGGRKRRHEDLSSAEGMPESIAGRKRPREDLSSLEGMPESIAARKRPREDLSSLEGMPESIAGQKRGRESDDTPAPAAKRQKTGDDTRLDRPADTTAGGARLDAPAPHVPTPPPSPAPASQRPAAPRPAAPHVDPNGRPHVDPGLEMLHLSQPGLPEPPPAYTPRPDAHAPAGPANAPEAKPGAQAGAKPPAHGEAKPDAHDGQPSLEGMPEDGKKGMSTGKKVLIGIAAFFGISFLFAGGSSQPPPSGG